jgi:hypothetical protein
MRLPIDRRRRSKTLNEKILWKPAPRLDHTVAAVEAADFGVVDSTRRRST